MKRNQIITLVVVLAFIGALAFINRHEPARVSQQQAEEAAQAQKMLDEANGKKSVKERNKEAVQGLIAKAEELAVAEAPYQVEFQCSNGTFVVEIHPEWAPIGAAQFKKILEAGIYNEARFFRVLPKFVVQWGIPGDPEKAAEWDKRNIQDEKPKTSNLRGTISYAKSQMPNSRSSQVFINLRDNDKTNPNADLDSMDFAPFGKVVKGMEVVDKINSEYLQDPDQDEIMSKGNAYLKEHFPKLDYIKEAKILGAVSATAAAPALEPAAGAPELASATAN